MTYKEPKPYLSPPPVESKIQADIVKYLKYRDIPYYKTSAMHSRGWTDLVCCYNGAYVGLEVKRPYGYGSITPIQERHINTIREADGYATVVYCVQDVINFFEKIDKERK